MRRDNLPSNARRRPSQTMHFGAQSRGLRAPCERFAPWVTPGPRITRFRLAADLGRMGLDTHRVSNKVSKITSRHLVPLDRAFPAHAVGAFFEQRALRYYVVNPLATFRVREARQMGRDKRDLTDAELAGVALRRRVASSLPGCTRSRARGVLVFGGVGLPHRCVCHDRGPGRIGGPCVSRGAQAGGVRPLPPPATRRCRGAVRLYAVPRRTRRRGDAVRGAAGPAGWGRWRAGTACACCARYSTSWSPASSSSCSWIML